MGIMATAGLEDDRVSGAVASASLWLASPLWVSERFLLQLGQTDKGRTGEESRQWRRPTEEIPV